MDQLSNLFGGDQTQIQPFISPGAVTPEQQSLADYTYGENLVGEGNLFGTSGTGMSTMATQGTTGAEFGRAKQEGQMSDINQEAMYQRYQNDLQTSLSELARQNANEAATQTALGKLIGQFGSGTQGNFNPGTT